MFINPCIPGDRDEFINKNIGLVHYLCHKYFNGYFNGNHNNGLHEYSDLAAIGCIGLIKAYNKFDNVKFDNKFSTYASATIIGEIHKYTRDYNNGAHFSRGMKAPYYKILYADMLESPIETIMEKLEMTEKEVERGLEYYSSYKPIYISQQINSGSEGAPLTLEDNILEEDDAWAVEGNIEDFILRDFLVTLANKQKEVCYWFRQGLTQNEVANRMRISQVQVSRIFTKILKLATKYGEQEREDSELGVSKQLTNEKRIQEKIAGKKNARSSRLNPDMILEVERLIQEGKLSRREIATKIGCSYNTVSQHVTKLLKKGEIEKPIDLRTTVSHKEVNIEKAKIKIAIEKDRKKRLEERRKQEGVSASIKIYAPHEKFPDKKELDMINKHTFPTEQEQLDNLNNHVELGKKLVAEVKQQRNITAELLEHKENIHKYVDMLEDAKFYIPKEKFDSHAEKVIPKPIIHEIIQSMDNEIEPIVLMNLDFNCDSILYLKSRLQAVCNLLREMDTKNMKLHLQVTDK